MFKVSEVSMRPTPLSNTDENGDYKELHDYGQVTLSVCMKNTDMEEFYVKVHLLHTKKSSGKSLFEGSKKSVYRSSRVYRWSNMIGFKLLGMSILDSDVYYRQGKPCLKADVSKHIRAMVTGNESVQMEEANWKKIQNHKSTSSRAKTLKNMDRITMAKWMTNVEKNLSGLLKEKEE